MPGDNNGGDYIRWEPHVTSEQASEIVDRLGSLMAELAFEVKSRAADYAMPGAGGAPF